MYFLRKAIERGSVDFGWLKSQHSFSFGEYYDPNHMGFGPLRVINEDRIHEAKGFETHGHRDMEIISYVIDGALEHKDSIGNIAVIKPGEVQRMSAGTGILHSEMNHLRDKKTHFLQIWIMPKEQGVKPGYDQKAFDDKLGCSDLVQVVSPDGKNGTVSINQDVDIYAGKATMEGMKTHKTYPHRNLWVQVIKGNVKVDNYELTNGDGLGINEVSELKISWSKDSEFLLFDMPK